MSDKPKRKGRGADRAEQRGLNRAFAVVVGAAVGLLVARFVILDTLEVMAWQMFWSGLAELRTEDAAIVFRSATFWKCFGCTAVGAILASVALDRSAQQGSAD